MSSVHSVSKKGRRPQNEDKHTVKLNINGDDKNVAPINFFAVYDGHGGKSVSKFLSDNLPDLFLNKDVNYPITDKYVEGVYEYLQDILKTDHKNTATQCGSTCMVALQFKNNNDQWLNILNTGDSRAVICRDNLGIPMTKDHKPNWPEEASRIKKLGGNVYFDGYDWRIKDLSVSRAFGDIESEPFITTTPDIFVHKLTKKDKFMVMACDGLWDVMSNQDAVNFVLENCYDIDTEERINKKINIAKKLADSAIQKGSGDNITILVIFF